LTVYEATSKEHFEKIEAFLARQPSESPSLVCWNLPSKKADWLQAKRQVDPNCDVLFCEDAERVIRVVWVKERRGLTGLNEPKISTKGSACVEYEDLKSGNLQFVKELLKYKVRKDIEFGLVGAQYVGVPALVDAAKTLLGDALTIQNEVESPVAGKLFRVYCDYSKVPREWLK